MQLRRLSAIGDESTMETEDARPQETIKAPNETGEIITPQNMPPAAYTPSATRLGSGQNDDSREGDGGVGAGVAIGMCFFLLTLMIMCKKRARRESYHSSGQRSVHHPGNKRKVVPLPIPPEESQNNDATVNAAAEVEPRQHQNEVRLDQESANENTLTTLHEHDETE